MISMDPPDAFKSGSPIAGTVGLWGFQESDIPMMKTFISRHMGPTQKLELRSIEPTAEDFYSFSWKTLDILLFSWDMLHGRGNGQTLFLNLEVPRKLWDEQQVVREKATKVKEKPWLHSLFPLNMAVGKGKWLGECNESRSKHRFSVDWSSQTLICSSFACVDTDWNFA